MLEFFSRRFKKTQRFTVTYGNKPLCYHCHILFLHVLSYVSGFRRENQGRLRPDHDRGVRILLRAFKQWLLFFLLCLLFDSHSHVVRVFFFVIIHKLRRPAHHLLI